MPIDRVYHRHREGQRVPVKSWCPELEDKALKQALDAASSPVAYKWVALMPDAHQGYGVPIGCVFPTVDAVIPNAVGVDIGCGMNAIDMTEQTGRLASEYSQDEIDAIMDRMTEYIPLGDAKFGPNRERLDFAVDSSHFGGFYDRGNLRDYVIAYAIELHSALVDFGIPGVSQEHLENQLGTLGGGNHFVELQRDERDHLWIMVHSGSRGTGASVARYYHQKAVELCEMFRSPVNRELAFLPLGHRYGQEYYSAMQTCVRYASLSRKVMLLTAAECVEEPYGAGSGFIYGSTHNYAFDLVFDPIIGKHVVVHLKGATLAEKDQLAIIPGSMTTKSYIVRGLGNKESFKCCSHGSGRVCSRKRAKEMVATGAMPSREDQLQSAGISVHGSDDYNDELGSAYKCIESVMQNQSDLVEPVHELTPIAVLKG